LVDQRSRSLWNVWMQATAELTSKYTSTLIQYSLRNLKNSQAKKFLNNCNTSKCT
jgi:hypothetical protein